MKLYDNKMANSPRKVRMFLSEKNINDIEMVEIDLMKENTRLWNIEQLHRIQEYLHFS